MYDFYKRVSFEHEKGIMDLCKVHFCIKKFFINTVRCSADKTDDVSIYLYVCEIILVLVCPVCLWTLWTSVKKIFVSESYSFNVIQVDAVWI